jgi:hypothetical protein
VIVAVTFVDVMAMAVDDVVDVVLVLDRFVPTFRAMNVLGIVTFTDVVAGGGAHVSFYGPG